MNPPDSNPKTVHGMKKCPLRLVPTVALRAEAWVMLHGADKYGPWNWRSDGISASTYYEAALRHLTAFWDGQDIDPESGHPHLAHARACLGILLDAMAAGKFNDDRPPALPR